jgi:hypothetical protein
MRDNSKTKQQLIVELEEYRQKAADAENQLSLYKTTDQDSLRNRPSGKLTLKENKSVITKQ